MSTRSTQPPRSARSASRSQQIDSLRRRIEATRWPTYELVHYASQGIQLAFPQELARYRAEGQTGDLGRDPRAPSAETAETRTPSLLA